MLGTDSDAVIAKKLGCSRSMLSWKRKQLKIPAFQSKHSNYWTEEEIKLLGTDTDESIAKKVGRGISAVQGKQYKIGISVYKK